MRVNKFVANALGVSRRRADELIESGRIYINEAPAKLGQQIALGDSITLDRQLITSQKFIYIALNKPVGFVSSKSGQGTETLYDLLPKEYSSLPIVGRLDKDSSGLIVLTNDGDYAYQLTHPKFAKTKEYFVTLDSALAPRQLETLNQGVMLDDGPSKLQVAPIEGTKYEVSMSEGRNRQIRRSFSALGINVISLHRTRFGPYSLDGLKSGQYKQVKKQ